MGSSTSTSMRASARPERHGCLGRPASAKPAATVEVTKSRRVKTVTTSARRVAANHAEPEHRRDLAAVLRLEPHRHLLLAVDQLRRNGILSIEEGRLVAETNFLTRDALAVDQDIEGRGRPPPVTRVIGRDQRHGMRRLD